LNLPLSLAGQHGLDNILAVEQSTKECGHFSGTNVPGAVANGVLTKLALRRRVVGKSFLNKRNKFFWRAIDLYAWCLEVLVKRRNDRGYSGGEIFTNLNRASVAGECVVLVPRKYTHVDVAIIAGKFGITLGAEKMDVGRR